VTMKRWSALLTAAGFALALSATSGLACDDHKKAAETADAKSAGAKTAKAVPAADTAVAEHGCCAKKAAATAAKQTAPSKAGKAVPAVATAGCDKPCDGAAADAAGCPKKAAPATATVAEAKPQPAQEAAPADPGKDH